MKRTAPSSEPLPNSRHEAFAREVASGRSATQAYLNVYGTKNSPCGPHRVASTGGSRLLRREGIVARIKSLQKAGAAVVALNLQEIHDFLTRVVRTPAGDIVPSSDLCTHVKHTRDGTTDVWMPNKLACLRLSAKLQGFLDHAHIASLAQTASPARTDSADPPQPGSQFILTEERRAILIARRRAAIQADRKQAAEDRLARQKERGAGLPTRDGPSGPPCDIKPPMPFRGPEPVEVSSSNRQPGPSLRQTTPPAREQKLQVPENRPTAEPSHNQLNERPSTTPTRPTHLAWAAYPVSRNTMSPPRTAVPLQPLHPASCNPASPARTPASCLSNHHQHRPSFSRVTPDSSSGIVII